MKKRYEHIWEGNRMRVFEYEGRVLCHEYRGYPISEGSSILLTTCNGGYITRGYPYHRKYISCEDTIRIDRAPRSLPRSTATQKKSLLPAPVTKKGQEKELEQIKLF